MKVKELINLLQKEDPEKLVIVSSDPEGNSFSEISDSPIESNCVWDAENQELHPKK